MAREVHTPDLLPTDELDGVLDYKMLVQGIPRIETTTEREFKDVEAWEKFMAELVVISVHPTTDKNAPPSVPVGNNGLIVWLPRDRKIRIPRSYVERLAQSQELAFTTKRNPDPGADEGMVTHKTAASPFPFSVLQDPSGARGERWLRNVMRRG